MNVTRRQLVGGAGAGVASVSAVGWIYRKQLRRRDDSAAIRDALDVDGPPAVETGAVVTDDHLQASYDRAQATVDEAVDVVGEGALEATDLSAWSPEALSGASRGERRNAIGQLAWHASQGRGTLAGQRHAQGEADWEALSATLDEERAAARETAFEYTAGSPTEAVIQYAPADANLYEATTALADVDPDPDGDQDAYAQAWFGVERGATQRRDAERYGRAVEGEAHRDALEGALDRLLDAVDAAATDLDRDHDEAEANYASTVVEQLGLTNDLRESLADRREEPGPYLAHGIQLAAYRHAYFASLDAFTDVPAEGEWDDVAPDADAAALADAKRDAVDALEAAIDETGDDPLARWLVGEVRDTVPATDDHMEWTAENSNVWSDDEWRNRIARAELGLREVAAVAAQIPETVALVEG